MVAKGLRAPTTLNEYALKFWSIKGQGVDGRQPFSFDGYPFLVDLYAETSREIVIQKSAQCGISEWLLCRSFFLAEVHKATGLFCQPKDRQLGDFSHARIDPAIRHSPHLREKVKGVNNVGLKEIAGAYLYFRGMQNLDQINSIDADFVFLDEYDRMNQTFIPTVKKRMGASSLKHFIVIGNPSFPSYGINAAFQKSDGREWFIKCDPCGESQVLTFDGNVFPAVGNKPAYFGCRKCSRPIKNTKAGEWIAARPGVDVTGYHISKLMTPTVTAQELIDDEKESKTAHFNLNLGLPYARAGGKLGPEYLNACRGEEASTQDGSKLSLGVDVGKVLHCVLSDASGRVLDAFEVDEFEELDELMRKQGRVWGAVVDALPETRAAKKFAEKFAGRVWLAYYTDTPKGETRVLFKNSDKKRKHQIDLARTETMDDMYEAIRDRDIVIPSDIDEEHDFYKHLCAPIRITEKNRTGNMVARYDEFSHPDHYAHALNYSRAATWIRTKKTAKRTLTTGYTA